MNDTPGRDEWSEKCRRLLHNCGGIELHHHHLLLIRDPFSVLSSWMGKSGDIHGNYVHPDEVGISSLMDVYVKIVGSSMTGSNGCEFVDDDGLGQGQWRGTKTMRAVVVRGGRGRGQGKQQGHYSGSCSHHE